MLPAPQGFDASARTRMRAGCVTRCACSANGAARSSRCSRSAPCPSPSTSSSCPRSGCSRRARNCSSSRRRRRRSTDPRPRRLRGSGEQLLRNAVPPAAQPHARAPDAHVARVPRHRRGARGAPARRVRPTQGHRPPRRSPQREAEGGVTPLPDAPSPGAVDGFLRGLTIVAHPGQPAGGDPLPIGGRRPTPRAR